MKQLEAYTRQQAWQKIKNNWMFKGLLSAFAFFHNEKCNNTIYHNIVGISYSISSNNTCPLHACLWPLKFCLLLNVSTRVIRPKVMRLSTGN